MKVVGPRLDWFVQRMRDKLQHEKNQRKPDWRGQPLADLYTALDEELSELWAAIHEHVKCPTDDTRAAVILEAADVGNRAMMVADRAVCDFTEAASSSVPEGTES